VEGIVIQRIDHVDGSVRCIDSDHGVVDGIGHRDIKSPVPVGNPEGGSRCLVYVALAGRVSGGDLLSITPEDLLL